MSTIPAHGHYYNQRFAARQLIAFGHHQNLFRLQLIAKKKKKKRRCCIQEILAICLLTLTIFFFFGFSHRNCVSFLTGDYLETLARTSAIPLDIFWHVKKKINSPMLFVMEYSSSDVERWNDTPVYYPLQGLVVIIFFSQVKRNEMDMWIGEKTPVPLWRCEKKSY